MDRLVTLIQTQEDVVVSKSSIYELSDYEDKDIKLISESLKEEPEKWVLESPKITKEEGDRMKKDYGKLPWHLFPDDAAEEIVKVLEFGAKKYAPRGWEAGMDWSRLYSALRRHLVAWFFRRGNDPDTGLSHLAHAGCCILFLLAYELRGAGTDDRP